MFKNFLIILLALFIDGFQALITVAFTGAGAMAGTVAGGVGALKFCENLPSGVVQACVAAGSLVGTLANPLIAGISIPLGVMLGFVMGTIASLTLGTVLVFILAWNDMFHPQSVVVAYLCEVIPGFDVLPAWTALAVRSVFQKEAADAVAKASGGSKLLQALTATASGDAVGAVKNVAQQNKTTPEAREAPPREHLEDQGAVEQTNPPQKTPERRPVATQWQDVKPQQAANDDPLEQRRAA